MKIIYSLLIALSLSLMPVSVKPISYEARMCLDALWSITMEKLAQYESDSDAQKLRILGFFNVPSLANEITMNLSTDHSYLSNYNEQKVCFVKLMLLMGIYISQNEKVRSTLQNIFPGIEKLLSCKGASLGNIVLGHGNRMTSYGYHRLYT